MEPNINPAKSLVWSSPETRHGILASYAGKDDVSAATLHSLDRHSVKSIRFSGDTSVHQLDQLNFPRNPQATPGIQRIVSLRDSHLSVECHTYDHPVVTGPHLHHASPINICDHCSAVGNFKTRLTDCIRDENGEYWVRTSGSNSDLYMKVSELDIQDHFGGTCGSGRDTSSMFNSSDNIRASNAADETQNYISSQPEISGIGLDGRLSPGRGQGFSQFSGKVPTLAFRDWIADS